MLLECRVLGSDAVRYTVTPFRGAAPPIATDKSRWLTGRCDAGGSLRPSRSAGVEHLLQRGRGCHAGGPAGIKGEVGGDLSQFGRGNAIVQSEGQV